MTWDEEFKGMKREADRQLDNSPWPAVIVLLGILAVIAFFGWMIFGGSGC